MTEFWRDGEQWYGLKVIDGVPYSLDETDDHSFAETHSYIWATKSGVQAHLTEEERAQLPA